MDDYKMIQIQTVRMICRNTIVQMNWFSGFVNSIKVDLWYIGKVGIKRFIKEKIGGDL